MGLYKHESWPLPTCSEVVQKQKCVKRKHTCDNAGNATVRRERTLQRPWVILSRMAQTSGVISLATKTCEWKFEGKGYIAKNGTSSGITGSTQQDFYRVNTADLFKWVPTATRMNNFDLAYAFSNICRLKCLTHKRFFIFWKQTIIPDVSKKNVTSLVFTFLGPTCDLR